MWKERKHREDWDEAQWAEGIYAAFGFNTKGGRKMPEKSLDRNYGEKQQQQQRGAPAEPYISFQTPMGFGPNPNQPK